MSEVETFVAGMHRSAELKRQLAENPTPVIAIVDACEIAINSGKKLMFCGNGGSAGDAQHLATELLIRLRGSVPRRSLPALALTLDPAALTACGNDFGFDQIFERPLQGLGQEGDVLFGITTSGRSANVVRALNTAREMGIVTVGFLGGTGLPALDACDHAIVVPETDTARIQECHITLGHLILTMLEDRIVKTA